MSGRCLEKLPHSCGTSDALQVFEDHNGQLTGYCFACSSYIPNPYGDNPPNISELKSRKFRPDQTELIKQIQTYCTVALPERKLEEWALSHFDIKIGLSEIDGRTPILSYFPYYKDGKLSAYKTKILENKKMWIVGEIKDCNLFGWEQAKASGAKTLFITEGEEDAVALYQALRNNQRGTKWEHLMPAVVSLISGASSAGRDIISHAAEIRTRFKDVVLVFDEDNAGRKAVDSVKMAFPSVRTASLPAKDANECLIQGREKALCNAVLFNSSVPKNTRLIWGQSLYEEGRQKAKWGLSWPWKGLTELTRGIRFGETYYLGAGVKMGKSELVNALAAHLITEHDLSVFLAKPEEINKKTYQMVLGKVVGRHFHDPTVDFDYEAYDEAAKLVGDRLCLLNLYQHVGWDTLRSDIVAAVNQGCKAVFIDPITNLINGVNSADANTVLQAIAQDLAAMAKDMEFVAFIFCHLKAPDSGDPHERGGKVLSHQFSGSRAMMRSCNLMLGLEGNKDPDLPLEQRNIRRLVILEDREFGATGVVKLYWDHHTGLFHEIQEKKSD